MAKYIVRKGESFFWSSPPKIEQCRTYGEGEIVDLPDVKGKPPVVGPNLRLLTAAELKQTPSTLKKIELGEDEKPVEEPPAGAYPAAQAA